MLVEFLLALIIFVSPLYILYKLPTFLLNLFFVGFVYFNFLSIKLPTFYQNKFSKAFCGGTNKPGS